MFDLDAYMAGRIRAVEKALDAFLPPEDKAPESLHTAMRYSVFAGGKRIRPILCLAAADAVRPGCAAAMTPAAAVELLHTYSLIHDDLPAMDDDDLRRGRPTCHVAFGEANAILAGDALLTLSFGVLTQLDPSAACTAGRLVAELAEAAGSRGMVGGQAADLAAEGSDPDIAMIESIHERKTAALIRAAVRMGGLAAGATDAALDSLSRYGTNIGLAFQIVDDILNATSSPEVLGKPAGSDKARRKATAVAVLGLPKARRKAEELIESAVAGLAGLPGTVEPLKALARLTASRVR